MPENNDIGFAIKIDSWALIVLTAALIALRLTGHC